MIQNFVWILSQACGEFIAICEGDDYWIDSDKLRKQVDYLQMNSAYILCGTNFRKNIDGKIINIKQSSDKLEVKTFEDVLEQNPFATPTVCFKRVTLSKVNLEIFGEYTIGDRILWLELLKHGLGCVLSDVTTVYREHSGGIYSSKSYQEQKKTTFFNLIKYIKNNGIVLNERIKLKLKKDLWNILYYRKDFEKRIALFEEVESILEINSKKKQLFLLIARTPHFLFTRIGWRVLNL